MLTFLPFISGKFPQQITLLRIPTCCGKISNVSILMVEKFTSEKNKRKATAKH